MKLQGIVGVVTLLIGRRLLISGATSATTCDDGPLLTLGTLYFEIYALGRPSILTDGANPTRKFCYFGEEL